MLKNYLTVAWRSFIRHKGYTLINILGLSVAICCFILIMLFVRSEFSYDNLHSKANRLYRAWMFKNENGKELTSTITSLPLGPFLQKNISEVESTCRVYSFNTLIKNENNNFNESVHMVDYTFFKMFDFKILEGELLNPWPTNNSIIISEANAKKYFSKVKAIGKTIELQLGDDKLLFTVSGIVANNSSESSIKTDILIPFSNNHYLFNDRMRTAWGNIFTETYVLLKKKANVNSFEKKMPRIIKSEVGDVLASRAGDIHLQPIKAIHLDTSLPQGIEPTSNPKIYYVLSTIGLFIIILACINFVTISIGRSTTRSLEVGVRKVLGAERHQLIKQFWGEAFLITMVSVLVGVIVTIILFHPFNLLIGKNLSFRMDLEFLLFFFLLVAFIAMIAGIYPALILSGFKPIEVLKGRLKSITSIGVLSKTLITGQFVVSIAIIICTLIVQQQLNYLTKKDLGYHQKNIIIIPTNLNPIEGMKLANLYQQALSKLPRVASSSIVMYGLDEEPWAEMGYTDDKHVTHNFQFNSVDASFLKTMDVQLAEGNNFFTNNDSSILVNETYVKEYGLKDPVGMKLPGPFDQKIIGVVHDFNIESLHTRIKPLVLTTNFETISQKAETMLYHHALKPKISVRLTSGDLAEQIAALKNTWQEITPNQDFEFRFLDQNIALRYEQDKRTGTIIKLASALSIFIACMGLFGLVTQVVVNRTREIGIRKVLGARISAIVVLLSKDFIKLVFIAVIIASPVAWYFMNSWLQDFAYRITMSWWIFVLAGIAGLFIALITVSIQAIKAALSNPAKNLRTE